MKLVHCGASVAFAMLLVGLGSVADAEDDFKKLQGKWVVETFEYNGMPVERMKDAVREFADRKYMLIPKNGDAIEGTAKLDEATKPKQIDLKVGDRTLQGIYEVDGDTFKLSYTLTNGERPTEFASKPDSGTTLIIHKRVK